MKQYATQACGGASKEIKLLQSVCGDQIKWLNELQKVSLVGSMASVRLKLSRKTKAVWYHFVTDCTWQSVIFLTLMKDAVFRVWLPLTTSRVRIANKFTLWWKRNTSILLITSFHRFSTFNRFSGYQSDQDTSLTRIPVWPGYQSDQDTSLTRIPVWPGYQSDLLGREGETVHCFLCSWSVCCLH